MLMFRFLRGLAPTSKSSAALIAAAVLTLTPSNANAAVLVDDDFDVYASQAAFEASWTPIGTNASAPSALLSTFESATAPNSIFVPGSAVPTPNGQHRNRLTFAETNSFSASGNLGIGDVLTWSFDFFDAQATGQPQRNYANLQDGLTPTAANQIVAMGLNNNRTASADGGNYYMARILGYTPTHSGAASGDFFKLNGVGAPVRSSGWNNLKVEISTSDALTTDFRFFVNNTLAKTLLGIGNASQIRSYDNIVIGSGLTNNNVSAGFDNMRLEYDSFDPFRNEWLNPAGGDYGDGTNWAKRLPPSPEDTAIFDLDSAGYTITAFGPVWAPGLLFVQNDRVTLDFGSATWNNALFSELRVGTLAGDQGELTVASGNLTFNQLMIGRDGGQGHLTVAGPATTLAVVDQGLASNNLNIAVGRNGAGKLYVSQGGSVSVTTDMAPNASRIYVGVGVNGNGLLEVSDSNSALATGNLTIGGQGGHGRMNVLNGGSATINGLLFVSENEFSAPSTAQGVLEVSGANARLSSTRQIQVGRDGSNGSVVVSNGGRLESSIGTSPTGTSAIIAWLNSSTRRSQGSVLVTGAGSTWVNEGLVVVGWDGDGTLDIEMGGSVQSRRGQLGRTTGGVGNAIIDGAGSAWLIEEDLSVGGTEAGARGVGTLVVASSGRVDVGQTLRVWGGSSINVAGGGTIGVGQEASQSSSGSVLVSAGGTLSGAGSIVGSVSIDGGLVRPELAASLLTVSGDYAQSASGQLEIEVGGLQPGVQHDRLAVGGMATIGGQLGVPLISGYVPQLGDSVTILTAADVTGQFNSVFIPDLPVVAPNLAVAVVRNATDVQLQFVSPQSDIQFVPNTTVVDWAQTDTWSTGEQPDSRHIIAITNSSSGDQRVNVQTSDAIVHELVVSGDANYTTTLAVENGRTISATTGVSLNSGAVLDMGGVGSPGTLTAPKVVIGPGALARGSFRVGQKKSDQKKLLEKRNQLANKGTLRLGRSVGYIEIDGDYAQESEGLLEIEIASSSSFDKLIVEGAATLGGTLDVLLLDYTPQLGDTFDFIDWETVSGAFDFVNLPTLPGGLVWDQSQLYATGSLSIVQATGDFDGDGDVDGRDFLAWQRDPGVGNLADWQANYGNNALNSALGVPEPASLLSLGTLIFVTSFRQRRGAAAAGRRGSSRPAFTIDTP